MATNDEDVLNLYLRDINKIALLSHEEEAELAQKAKDGDKAARDRIVKANLRFVVNIAKKYQNQGIDLIDLISEGNIGLLIAIDRFDASKGYHFISYAVWWIRQSILKAICEKSRAIRLPLNRANELVQIKKAHKMLGGKVSEDLEIKEIGEMINMDAAHVHEMLNLSQEMMSLDAQIASEGVYTSYGDFLEDDRYNPEEDAIAESMKDAIDETLHTLKPNEETVLRCRFGLGGGKPMSLKEVGDVCHLTKERIRQIEKHAIVRMKHPRRMEMLEAYVA